MAIKTKTELKDEIAENKLTKDLMNNMVDSMLDVVDGPLDFTNEAVIQVDGDTKLTIDTNGDATFSGDINAPSINNDSGVDIGVSAGDKVSVDGSGRLYGTALHDNGALPTGTVNQYIASGTYTPTVTGISNVTSTIDSKCQWMRVGNVVTVSGVYEVQPTIAALTSLRVSLPIPSNFSGTVDGGGVASPFSPTIPMASFSDAASNEMAFQGVLDHTTSEGYYFTLTYEVK